MLDIDHIDKLYIFSTQGCTHGNGAIELAHLLGQPNRQTKLIVKQVVNFTVTKIRNFREHYLAASTQHQGSMQHASYPAIVATFEDGREPIFIGGFSDFKRMVFGETADQKETQSKIKKTKSVFNLTRNGRGRATFVPHRLSTSHSAQSRRIAQRKSDTKQAVQPQVIASPVPQVIASPVPPQVIAPAVPHRLSTSHLAQGRRITQRKSDTKQAVQTQVIASPVPQVIAPPVPPQVIVPPVPQATSSQATSSQATTYISQIRFPFWNHRFKKCTIF